MIIRDPMYGDMSFTENEMKIIESSSFDRLRRIKQLSFSEYVYPSATHNRFSHSLGVTEIVSRMFDIIQRKTGVFRQSDKELIRMIGLCHDIGHSPFSHSSEILSDITHEDRMKDILQLEKSNIILDTSHGVASWDIINQVYNGEGTEYFSDPKFVLLRSLMDNFIDADKIDYLFRDALYCGLKYGEFDRDKLLNSLTLVDDKGSLNLAIEYDGLQALESFIVARYYMFTQVYFHPVRRLYDILFVEYMKKLLKEGVYPNDVKKFLSWDDTRVAQKLFTSKEFSKDYCLVYDSDFDLESKMLIDSKLGDLIICDTPKKNIFRKKTDSNLYVVDSLMGTVVPASQVSPILKSIEYASIHKLRYYALSDIAKDVHNEILKILGRK